MGLYPKGFGEKRKALAEYLDFMCELRAKQYKGWVAWTEKDNLPMLEVFLKLGAKPFHQDDQFVFVYRTVPKDEQNGTAKSARTVP